MQDESEQKNPGNTLNAKTNDNIRRSYHSSQPKLVLKKDKPNSAKRTREYFNRPGLELVVTKEAVTLPKIVV